MANEQKEKLKFLLSVYAAEDIFNTDKTILFCKILPKKTLAFKGDNTLKVRKLYRDIQFWLYPTWLGYKNCLCSVLKSISSANVS